MRRKLMKCRFCGSTRFRRSSRTTPAVVRIWCDDSGLTDEIVGEEWEDTLYDYQCVKCRKKSNNCEDLLREVK